MKNKKYTVSTKCHCFCKAAHYHVQQISLDGNLKNIFKPKRSHKEAMRVASELNSAVQNDEEKTADKLKILSVRVESRPSIHRVKLEGKARVFCQNDGCKNPADVCEHCHWNTGNTKGLSFFYYCQSCFDARASKFTRDDFAGEKFRLVNRESGAKDQLPKHGIIAKAEIQLGEGSPIQTIRSGGLWGIESDSGADYIKEVQDGQLAELQGELAKLGFTARQIKYAFKGAKRD